MHRHLINLLRFGFPLGIEHHQALCRSNVNNHSTAREYPNDIEAYIAKERDHGVLLGPFTEIPHNSYHCSPMLTIHKDGDTRRVIVDLSYGDNSVNGHTVRNEHEGHNFELKLPTMDHIVDQILHTNDPLLMKVDISLAFRNVMVDPRDAIKCGIQHNGQFFIDKALVFEAVMGTKIFQRISDAIAFIMIQKEDRDMELYR